MCLSGSGSGVVEIQWNGSCVVDIEDSGCQVVKIAGNRSDETQHS